MQLIISGKYAIDLQDEGLQVEEPFGKPANVVAKTKKIFLAATSLRIDGIFVQLNSASFVSMALFLFFHLPYFLAGSFDIFLSGNKKKMIAAG